MDNVLIINFNEWMRFQVYKCGGCLHDNIDDKIIDGSAIVSVELSFQKSWMEAYDWCMVWKVQG
jgi:hypothetical protein